MSIELWALVISIIAIVVEGPMVYWLAKRDKNKDKEQEDNSKELQKVHARITQVERRAKEYTDQQIVHVKETQNLHYETIMEQLAYIRSRVDGQQKNANN